jgi:SAM-dependent methyltransferase
MPRRLDDSTHSPARRKALRVSLAGLSAAWSCPLLAQVLPQPFPLGRPDVPYEPTPQPMVDRMLMIAAVNENDLVYDLGCGDGRIVITAAKNFGAHGVGIDIDPQRIHEARENARMAGVEDKARFQAGDLFASDFSAATVVTLFLWPHINRKLRPALWRQLQVGTRVVSYIWEMGAQWPAERTEYVGGKKIYYWTIKADHKRLANDT